MSETLFTANRAYSWLVTKKRENKNQKPGEITTKYTINLG